MIENRASAREPLITVGIACFNAEDTIARAVESARAQDWPHLEIIVVDDGSSDRSVDTVAKIAAGDARVRLIRHEKNLGPGGTRQTILDQARGEFLAFFDDDDEDVLTGSSDDDWFYLFDDDTVTDDNSQSGNGGKKK